MKLTISGPKCAISCQNEQIVHSFWKFSTWPKISTGTACGRQIWGMHYAIMRITCAKGLPGIEVHRVAIHTLCTFRWCPPQGTCALITLVTLITLITLTTHYLNWSHWPHIDHINHLRHSRQTGRVRVYIGPATNGRSDKTTCVYILGKFGYIWKCILFVYWCILVRQPTTDVTKPPVIIWSLSSL